MRVIRMAGLGLALIALLVAGKMLMQHSLTPHTVTLNWQTPPDVPGVKVVGYNVYRKETTGTQFTRIATRVTGLSYEDRLVTSGKNYSYVVTSTDQAGRESRFSEEVKAQVP
jgi:fibronectin type 3 domain-containing protein